MSDEPKIYLVVGTTGEYSDRSDWPVRAYLSEDNAKRHRDAASTWAAKFFREHPHKRHSAEIQALMRACPHDDHFQMDYTGTEYEIWEAPLGDAPLPPEPPLRFRRIRP